MDLNVYLRPLVKWWWLILAATLIAIVSSFLVTSRQPPLYQSRSTLVVGSAVYESNPTGGDFYLNQQLARFYSDIAQRELVRNATKEALGLSWLPDYLVQSVPNTQLIEVIVTDTMPERAQMVANELAAQLIKQTPTGNPEEQEHQAFIDDQLRQLEAKITETQAEISNKQTELADLFSARQIAETQSEIAALENKLSDLQTNYATLLTNSNRGAVNTLSVIETANLPTNPVGPNTQIVVLMSAAIALLISTGAAYLLEFLDDTLKSPEEISKLLQVPVIGYIAEIDGEDNQGAYVANNPRSGIAEAFRSLRTDLEFSAVDQALETIYISSANTSAGKTTVSANLAVIIAQGGKKVVLLDADLRKPKIHRSLGIANQKGLSDVFRGNLDLSDVEYAWEEGSITVITSGEVPPNPSELLGSKKMDQILTELKKKNDVVIIDGPPFLVADATILSTKVDGVLLVIRYGLTRKNEAVAAMNQLRRSGSRVVGLLLNGIPKGGKGFYGVYTSYQNYYEEDKDEAVPRNGRVRIPEWFRIKKRELSERFNPERTST